MSRILRGVVLAVFVAAAVFAAPALTINSDTTGVANNGHFSLGYQFSLVNPYNVTMLGFWDYLGDGFDTTGSSNGGVDVAIYAVNDGVDASGTLLASTTVFSGSGIFSNVLPDGSAFRYTMLGSPVALGAGTYEIVGTNHGESYLPNANPADVTFNPAVSFVGNVAVSGDTLQFSASTSGSTPAFFGPNFNDAQVPEPATFGLGLMGLSAILLWRRRRA